jgi:thiaminase (transcriptional activator TenA)
MSTPIRASDAFREESDAICTVLHQHPFITELAEGTLPLDKFRFFLEQDDFISRSTAGAWPLGVAKSRNERELRYFTVHLNQVLDPEIPNNRELLARVIELGAEDRGGSLTIMAPANVAYTSYLQALALRGGPLDIMAALLPARGATSRSRPLCGNGWTRRIRSTAAGSPTSPNRRSFRWSPGCATISTSS